MRNVPAVDLDSFSDHLVEQTAERKVSLIRPRILAWKVGWRVVFVCVWGVGRLGVGTARGMKHSIWGMLNIRFEKYPKGFM